jgi:hypothetical protein
MKNTLNDYPFPKSIPRHSITGQRGISILLLHHSPVKSLLIGFEQYEIDARRQA